MDGPMLEALKGLKGATNLPSRPLQGLPGSGSARAALRAVQGGGVRCPHSPDTLASTIRARRRRPRVSRACEFIWPRAMHRHSRFCPPPSPRKYWTRRGIAEWLVEKLSEDAPTLVGIDHGFSFPLRYLGAIRSTALQSAKRPRRSASPARPSTKPRTPCRLVGSPVCCQVGAAPVSSDARTLSRSAIRAPAKPALDWDWVLQPARKACRSASRRPPPSRTS